MVLLVAYNTGTDYSVSLKKNNKVPYESPINLKFDSGATFTNISHRLLKGMMVEDSEYEFTYYNKKVEFNIASDALVKGYLCSMKNISLGSIVFPEFYFFMTFNNKDTGLLGYEIIDNFKFSHDINGNIVINEFDKENYKKIVKGLTKGIKENTGLSLDECYKLCLS